MDDNEIAIKLRERGLTCSKLNSMINKQLKDSKQDMNDASKFRAIGFNEQANLQEKIANAQKQSANKLKSLYSRVCRRL